MVRLVCSLLGLMICVLYVRLDCALSLLQVVDTLQIGIVDWIVVWTGDWLVWLLLMSFRVILGWVIIGDM